MQFFLLLCCCLSVAVGLQYGTPIVINCPVNDGSNVKLYQSMVLVGSETNLLLYHNNGTLLRTISTGSYINGFDVSVKYQLIAINGNDSVARLYTLTGSLITSIDLSDGDYNWPIFVDEWSQSIVMINATWNETNNDQWTNIVYFDFKGTLKSYYTVKYITWNVIINPNNGNLLCDTFLLDEPAVYISIVDSTGLIRQINTTRKYPATGLTVDSNNTIITTGYNIALYQYNGSLIRYLYRPSELIESPQAYNDYIVYMDSYSNNTCNQLIRFIDYDGYQIMTVVYSDTGRCAMDNSLVLIDTDGTLVASVDNQIKIWQPV
jgi:hypothetical protein